MPKSYVKLPPLEVAPALAQALDAYAKTTGVPKAKIRREILFRFFEPMLADGDMTRRLEAADVAARAASGFGLGKDPPAARNLAVVVNNDQLLGQLPLGISTDADDSPNARNSDVGE